MTLWISTSKPSGGTTLGRLATFPSRRCSVIGLPSGPAPAAVNRVVNGPSEAIANPVRRRIVERLTTGPRRVGAATEGLAVSKPAISRHVRVLEDAGASSAVSRAARTCSS